MNQQNELVLPLGELTIRLVRFDDRVEDEGEEYHGFHLYITGPGLDVMARKYDGSDEISIQKGATPNDANKLRFVRSVGEQLFNCTMLSVLTDDADRPYQTV